MSSPKRLASGSRSPRSGRGRSRVRSRSGGAEDVPVIAPPDDGSAALEAFLAEGGFKRVTATDLCEAGGALVENPLNLTVYLHKDGVWRKLNDEEVLNIWKTAQITRRSFCTILKKNLFKLRGPHRTSLTRALQHATSADSIGFYEGLDDKYALVVRLPVDYETLRRNAKYAGFALATAGVLDQGRRGKALVSTRLPAEFFPTADGTKGGYGALGMYGGKQWKNALLGEAKHEL